MDVVRGIQQGLQFAAEGSTLCLQMPRVQRLFKVQGTILVAVMAVFYALGHVVLLPARLVSAVWGGDGGYSDTVLAFGEQALSASVLFMPFAWVLILRYFLWEQLNEIFFETLGTLDGSLASKMKAMAVHPITVWVYLRRFQKALGRALLVLLLTYFFPWIAPLLLLFAPVLQLGTKDGMTLLGGKLAMCLLLTVLVPPLRVGIVPVVQFWMGTRSIAKELLDPCLLRVPPKERRAMGSLEPILFGFAAPFAVALQVPVVGPLAFVVAYGAVAALVSARAEKDIFP